MSSSSTDQASKKQRTDDDILSSTTAECLVVSQTQQEIVEISSSSSSSSESLADTEPLVIGNPIVDDRVGCCLPWELAPGEDFEDLERITMLMLREQNRLMSFYVSLRVLASYGQKLLDDAVRPEDIPITQWARHGQNVRDRVDRYLRFVDIADRKVQKLRHMRYVVDAYAHQKRIYRSMWEMSVSFNDFMLKFRHYESRNHKLQELYQEYQGLRAVRTEYYKIMMFSNEQTVSNLRAERGMQLNINMSDWSAAAVLNRECFYY